MGDNRIHGWTEDRVTLLRELFVEGVSASVAAQKIGGVSRNTVIGKWHRLGLIRSEAQIVLNRTRGNIKRTATMTGRTASSFGQRPAAPARPTKAPPSTDVRKYAVAGGKVVELGPVLGLPQETAHSDPVFPLEALTIRCCRWPVGDPRSPDFGFCGKPKPAELDTPYCAEHGKLATAPMTASDRKRSDSQARFYANRGPGW
jgi:GcrA cell cycle regulator